MTVVANYLPHTTILIKRLTDPRTIPAPRIVVASTFLFVVFLQQGTFGLLSFVSLPQNSKLELGVEFPFLLQERNFFAPKPRDFLPDFPKICPSCLRNGRQQIGSTRVFVFTRWLFPFIDIVKPWPIPRAQLRPRNLWSEIALCAARIETTWNAKGDEEREREREKGPVMSEARVSLRTGPSRERAFSIVAPRAFLDTNDDLLRPPLRNPRSPSSAGTAAEANKPRISEGQPKPSRNPHRRTLFLGPCPLLFLPPFPSLPPVCLPFVAKSSDTSHS